MKHCKNLLLIAAAVAGITMIAGCSTKLSPEPFDANKRLTPGQVKMTVKIGVTTQAQIYKSLGSPNVVAIESDKGEIWTYDQIRVRRSANGYDAGAYFGTVFGYPSAGTTGGTGKLQDWRPNGPLSAAAVSADGRIDTLTTSVSTATLIIRFDKADRVASYKMLVTSF